MTSDQRASARALRGVRAESLPAWLAALLAVLAVAAAAAFIRREARTGHPLIPVRLLKSRPLAFGLAGAVCGYLALFGPLVLIPLVLARGPGDAARTGLLCPLFQSASGWPRSSATCCCRKPGTTGAAAWSARC